MSDRWLVTAHFDLDTAIARAERAQQQVGQGAPLSLRAHFTQDWPAVLDAVRQLAKLRELLDDLATQASVDGAMPPGGMAWAEDVGHVVDRIRKALGEADHG